VALAGESEWVRNVRAGRSGPAGARVQARYNFGLGPESTLADFERLAERYPVFRFADRGAAAAAPVARGIRGRRPRA
jgi:hypothetical protein